MGITAVATGLGVAASIGGTVVQYSAQRQAARAQETMARRQQHFSERAEASREQQMRLEATRRRRQAVREGLMARQTALATATGQGAQHGTGAAGAMGMATATGLQDQQTATAAETIGGHVFEANRGFAQATAQGQREVARAESRAALGGAISSVGGALVSNAPAFGRVGTFLTTPRTR